MKAVIVVRTGSTRLPKKCLLPFGDCDTVLGHMIFRALDFDYDPPIIVATTWLPEDDFIEGFVNNEVKRLAKCYRGVVDIGSRLEDMEEELDLCPYERIDGDDLFFIPKPKDGIHQYIGDWHDTAKGYKNCANKIRLTLDYWEDYWLLCTVVRCLEYKGDANADEILDLFKRNPDLYKVNWFRQEDYKENQQCELKESGTQV